MRKKVRVGNMENIEEGAARTSEVATVDLSAGVLQTIQSILNAPAEEREQDFFHLLERVKDLFHRMQTHEATKSETRDLLAEVLFSRLTHGYRQFVDSASLETDARKLAEFFLGHVLSTTVLSEFARVIDRVLAEEAAPWDYHLAGRADFISMEELLQLLSSGHHTGMLVLDNPDQRLDVYMNCGSVAFVDPHHVQQRMIRSQGLSAWREIPPDLLQEANETRAAEGLPVMVGLLGAGFFKEDDFIDHLREVSADLLYGALFDGQHSTFSYRAMDELPPYAIKYDLQTSVMPVLLEAHRRIDDWRHIRRVFPSLDEPIQPADDLFARIAEMSLDVVEIKVLALVNGENSFRRIAKSIGLNHFDLGAMLIGFGRDGIVLPPGGLESLYDENLGAVESVEEAVSALDANATIEALSEPEAGDPDAERRGFGLGFLKAARRRDRGSS